MRISECSSDVCSSDLDAESRPWMACGGESDRDVCRAWEHPPAGTPLLPKPAYGPSAKVATIPQQKAVGHGGPAAGTGTSRRRSGVDHGHPEGEVLLLARHVVHLRHRLRFGLRLADLEAAAEREERARQRQRRHAAEVLEDACQLADHRRAVLLDLIGGVDERLVHALQLAVAAHRHETATVLVLLDHVALGDGDLELGRLADLDVVEAQVTAGRSEEHTSELQSLMRISYAGFCLKK